MHLWVFDNDGTLYDDRAAAKMFMELVHQFVADRFDMTREATEIHLDTLKRRLSTRSTPLALLQAHDFNYDELVNGTYHLIDLHRCGVEVDPVDRRTIETLTGAKIVLSNAPVEYVRRVLRHTGIEGLFIDVLGMAEVDFHIKPDPRAYQKVEERFPAFTEFTLCDDRVENLDAAAQLGWRTIWLCREATSAESSHINVHSLEELLELR